MALRIGIDIGGTFTDLVVVNDESGHVAHVKTLTTPAALTEAVVAGLHEAGVDLTEASLIVHGTTVGINAVLEQRGAKTALLTTAGFRDVLEIGRGDFRRMYDVLYQRPPALVPRRLRLDVTERLASDGSVLTALDETDLARALDVLRAEQVESVAIAFLFAFRNPVHERRASQVVAAALPGVSITVSHQISQEWREYERTSTAVINAFIQPAVEGYLRELSEAVEARRFRGQLLIMQSNGGASSVAAARAKPVHTLESGPAAGVNGCAAWGARHGYERLIAFDVGGTTVKCCIIHDGVPQITEEHCIDGRPIRIPLLEIQEVGAGGGSLAWIDEGGALNVGPQSAGADPGPACYARGGDQATVTDANLLLGRISADAFLGGQMRLDATAAATAVDRVGKSLGLDRLATAAGILRLADVKMSHALKSITTERGLDPRDYALVAYGGGGPLHAVSLARELGIPRVFVPRGPATFSAWGMLAADLRHDLVRTVLRDLRDTGPDWAGAEFESMHREINGLFPARGARELRRAVDLRYEGQVHSVMIELPDLTAWEQLRARFDEVHERTYGYSAPEVEIELLNLRLTAVCPLPTPPREPHQLGARGPQAPDSRHIYSMRRQGLEPFRVYRRARLAAGDLIDGPAAVEEESTTTLLEAGDRLTIDDAGGLRIDVGR